jgi:hypothetical protein
LRRLLVLAATSLLHGLGKKGRLARRDRHAIGAQAGRVTVALANKLARILWAMMKTDDEDRRKLPRRGGPKPYMAYDCGSFFDHVRSIKFSVQRPLPANRRWLNKNFYEIDRQVMPATAPFLWLATLARTT